MVLPSKDELLERVRSSLEQKYNEIFAALKLEIEQVAEKYSRELEKVKDKFIARIG